MKRILFLMYQYLIYLPVGVLLTLFSASFTVVLCYFFKEKVSTLFLRYCWARPMIYLLFCRVKVTGKENLDPTVSSIYVANHQGAFDIFLLYGWLEADFRWIMKKELMRIPVVSYACKKVGHIPIDRKNKRSAMRSIEEAKERLNGGASVVFFPEGTRTRTGKMGSFKKGAFYLAKELNLRIAPLTINGVYNLLTQDSSQIRPFQKLELIIHKAISDADVKEMDVELLCKISEERVKEGLQE